MEENKKKPLIIIIVVLLLVLVGAIFLSTNWGNNNQLQNLERVGNIGNDLLEASS